MKTKAFHRILVVSALGVSSLAGPAVAHHSFAMYDRTKTLTVSGTVKKYVWANPHVVIDVLADNPKGVTEIWEIEASSPSVMARDGWTNRVLRAGDRIEIGIHPRKDGAPGGALADERRILVNGQPPKGVLFLQAPEDTCDR
jgi:hypothetical protein